MNKNDGGPAFARPAGDYSGTRNGNTAQVGMTLRDYFAAKAMQAMIANDWPIYDDESTKHLTGYAYRMADAMLAARDA
ncbi:hypothetical protein [Pseudomonas sp.]|uniref:hypothetical protein n=1 Tax=Pseudomonas sp. TaxID=306 RepID=UPI0031E202E8